MLEKFVANGNAWQNIKLCVFGCLRFCGGDTLLAAILVAAKYTTNNPDAAHKHWISHTRSVSDRRFLLHTEIHNLHLSHSHIRRSHRKWISFPLFLFHGFSGITALESFSLPATRNREKTDKIELKSVHNLFNLVFVCYSEIERECVCDLSFLIFYLN